MIYMSVYRYFIVYIVICLIYCSYYYFKKSREGALYRFFIITLIPVVGMIFLVISDILRKLIKDSGDVLCSYEKYIKGDSRLSRIRKSNFNDDNIIPLEEALILNKSEVKRKLIIDILKEDSSQYVKALKKALEDEDTETAHYAATAIMELKRTYNISIQKFSREYEKDKTNLNNLILYLNILKKYLQSGLLDEKSYIKYKKIYGIVLKNILKRYVQYEKYFVEKIKCEIELGNYVEAKEYCIKYFREHEGKEGPYLMYMNLFYSMNDHKNFMDVFNKLKESSIKLSNDGYNILQFWLRGDQN